MHGAPPCGHCAYPAIGHAGDVWPRSADELVEQQYALAEAAPPAWRPEPGGCPESCERAGPYGRLAVGGCFVCFPRGYEGVGAAGDPAWAGAAVLRGKRRESAYETTGTAGGPYEPGLLALREGPMLDAALRGLAALPDVLLVNATGRDHPRRAGLALHLGAELDVPSIGVTHRPLLASGDWPEDRAGATAPLTLDGEAVGAWLVTRVGRRPLAVHPGWRTDPAAAVGVVRRYGGRHRTPAPLREARRLARTSRARSRLAP